VQAVQFRIANRCAGGIVGTVNQNQLGISIRQLLDRLEIDTEVVLLPNSVVASLERKGFGQGVGDKSLFTSNQVSGVNA